MCEFFSCLSDGQGNLFYLNKEQREEQRGKDNNPDSHSTIAHVLKIDEDAHNKWEYNPITRVLREDHIVHGLNDKVLVQEALSRLNFFEIDPDKVEELLDPYHDVDSDIHDEIAKIDLQREFCEGDKVRIRTEEEFKTIFGPGWMDKVKFGFNENMQKYCGKEATITRMEGARCFLDIDIHWGWSVNMFQRLETSGISLLRKNAEGTI